LGWFGLDSGYELWRLRLFLFYGYGLALAALALVVCSAYDSYPSQHIYFLRYKRKLVLGRWKNTERNFFFFGIRPLKNKETF